MHPEFGSLLWEYAMKLVTQGMWHVLGQTLASMAELGSAFNFALMILNVLLMIAHKPNLPVQLTVVICSMVIAAGWLYKLLAQNDPKRGLVITQYTMNLLIALLPLGYVLGRAATH